MRIAFLATDRVERVELTEPWQAVEAQGWTPELVAPAAGEIEAVDHERPAGTLRVDRTLDEAEPSDYDALVLPGGVGNPDRLRTDDRAVAFARGFFEQSKPVAAICHGPWLLVEAGVVRGRSLTSWPSLRTDIRNAGGEWSDEEVVTDQGLVTSRRPDDLPAFCAKLVEEVREGRHPGQSAGATAASARG